MLHTIGGAGLATKTNHHLWIGDPLGLDQLEHTVATVEELANHPRDYPAEGAVTAGAVSARTTTLAQARPKVPVTNPAVP